jgi:hypothetical protein
MIVNARYFAASAALIVASLFPGNAMAQDHPRAIAMTVAREGDQMVVTLVGRSPIALGVGYTLEIDGESHTRHAGRSMVGPRAQTLSVVRFSDHGDWRIELAVDQADGARYALACDRSDYPCSAGT